MFACREIHLNISTGKRAKMTIFLCEIRGIRGHFWAFLAGRNCGKRNGFHPCGWGVVDMF